MTTPAQTNPGIPEPVDSSPRRALIVLLAAMFMALLDTTIVNVALPTIRTSLDAPASALSWIISGYALAFGLILIPAGRIADHIGHKQVFIAGLSLFTLASLACGFAQDGTQLIAARAVQGLAGGFFLPTVTAQIQLLFPPQSRAKAFSAMGAVIGFATALGPILGGLIIQAFGEPNGWRAVFWVNIPIGIVTLIAAVYLLPKHGKLGTKKGIDLIGLALFTAGLLAILIPLVEGRNESWPPWTFISLGAGALLLLTFGAWEVRMSKSGRAPLVAPSLFTHPAFTGGTVLALVYFASFTSIFFTIPLLWQAGLGHTALESGFVLAPFAIGSILGASQTFKLTEKLGRNVLILGGALFTAGLLSVWFILLFSNGTNLNIWQLLLPLFAAGLGNGFFISPNAQFITATVDRTQYGAASGVVNTAQRLGTGIGIAIIGSVFFGTLTVTGTGQDALATAFTHSATAAMSVNVTFSVIALLLIFTLPKQIPSPPMNTPTTKP